MLFKQDWKIARVTPTYGEETIFYDWYKGKRIYKGKLREAVECKLPCYSIIIAL